MSRRAPGVLAAAYLLVGGCTPPAGQPAQQEAPPPSAAPLPAPPTAPVQQPPPAVAFERKRRDIFGKTAPVSEQMLLHSLGYVTGTIDTSPELRGVLVHDDKRAFAGYNLYTSTDRKEALLIDMKGEVVHRWAYDLSPWTHVELRPNGDLIVVMQDAGIFAIDKDSKPLWKQIEPLHHGVFVERATGHVFGTYRKPIAEPRIHPTLQTLDEGVVELDARGKVLRRVSFLQALWKSPYAMLLPSIAHLVPEKSGGALDVLHSNHVEVLDGSLEKLGSLYERGNMLVSLRNLSAVAILDAAGEQVLWLWGPNNLQYQHHSTMLSNGNILLFNNRTDASRVIEIDPRQNRIVWQYAAPEFFSAARGSNQRLPNGNTLITESDKGYVFEVTPRGEVVWKFANPDVDDDGRRHAIWRMTRFTREELTFLPR